MKLPEDYSNCNTPENAEKDDFRDNAPAQMLGETFAFAFVLIVVLVLVIWKGW